MKKLFIVETTSDKQWEINTGFHIVSADSSENAKSVIEKELGKSIDDTKILSIKYVEDMLSPKGFATIIESSEM